MPAMSVSRFIRYFRETPGTSFVSYLNRVRVTAAADLLRNPDLSVGRERSRQPVQRLEHGRDIRHDLCFRLGRFAPEFQAWW